MKNKEEVCPLCGSGEILFSKMRLCVEILKMVGYQKEKTRYSYDNFSKEELFAVYKYLKIICHNKK